jgi:hypothetical protein
VASILALIPTTPHRPAARPAKEAARMSTPRAQRHLVLIDGHALFHRSFHAFPEEMTTQDGAPINAVYGFTRILQTAACVVSLIVTRLMLRRLADNPA